ncbi:MAG TPA: hypothetical protein VI278_01355 [Nitrososphaeraceae archaeon]
MLTVHTIKEKYLVIALVVSLWISTIGSNLAELTSSRYVQVQHIKTSHMTSNNSAQSRGTRTAGIKVGTSPSAIAVNSKTHMIYVVNYGSNTVSVIDGQLDQVVKNIAVGRSPFNVAVNSKTNLV